MTSNHPLTKKAREDLWNNPAKNMLTDEQRAEFETKGEHLYNQMDLDDMESNIVDAIAYITLQLRSGLHPSFLTSEERDVMQKMYGDDWESVEF